MTQLSTRIAYRFMVADVDPQKEYDRIHNELGFLEARASRMESFLHPFNQHFAGIRPGISQRRVLEDIQYFMATALQLKTDAEKLVPALPKMAPGLVTWANNQFVKYKKFLPQAKKVDSIIKGRTMPITLMGIGRDLQAALKQRMVDPDNLKVVTRQVPAESFYTPFGDLFGVAYYIDFSIPVAGKIMVFSLQERAYKQDTTVMISLPGESSEGVKSVDAALGYITDKTQGMAFKGTTEVVAEAVARTLTRFSQEHSDSPERINPAEIRGKGISVDINGGIDPEYHDDLSRNEMKRQMVEDYLKPALKALGSYSSHIQGSDITHADKHYWTITIVLK